MKNSTLKLRVTTENQMIEFENEKGMNVILIKQSPHFFPFMNQIFILPCSILSKTHA